MSKVLHLTLKKKWFDKTDSGEKPEEYREITQYWIKRLLSNIEHLTSLSDVEAVGPRFKQFDQVFARNGYNPKNRSWLRKWEGIHIGEGQEKWGAVPGKKYFIIKLGDKL